MESPCKPIKNNVYVCVCVCVCVLYMQNTK